MDRYIRLLILILLSMFSSSAEATEYPMPFMADTAWSVVQNWYDTPTHMGERALDFNWGSGSDDKGMPVVATCDGQVIYADWAYSSDGDDSGYGKVVLVDCGSEIQRTAHHKDIFVTIGQQVDVGQVIGTVGNSANGSPTGSGGYHLHFNITNSTNPNAYTSIEYSVRYTNGSGGNLSYDSYTSTNNAMFQAVNDEYSGRIGASTNAIHWYRGEGGNTSKPYRKSDNTIDDVYVQDHDDSGSTDGESAVIYDAINGARQAYLVRSGFWALYSGTCNGPSGNCNQNGVVDCGSPITDEYSQGSGTARQDFQSCYLYWNGSSASANPYPEVAPGWFENGGWNSSHSYAFAESYDRNGARNTMGEATNMVDGAGVHHWGNDSDLPYVQDFNGGSYGWAIIMHNSTMNEVFVIREGFWTQYMDMTPTVAGAPCDDESDTATGKPPNF